MAKQSKGQVLRVEQRKVADLANDPANARKHSDRNLDAIKASLTRFGQQKPIVIDSSGVVRAGNGTLMAAKALGWDSIACVVTDLSGAEAAAYAIADNRTAELAEWDDAVLTATLQSLADEDPSLLLDAGFDEKELAKLVAQTAEPLADDEVPEPPADPITKPGDLWLIGDHRVLCGDSTDEACVARVMGGHKAALCLTDPPYGLKGADSGKAEYKTFEDKPEQVEAMAKLWLPLARKHADAVVFSPGVTRQWWYPEPNWVMCWFYGGGQLRSPWGFNCWQPFLCYGKDPSLAAGNGARPDAVDMNTPANAGEIDHPCPKPMKLWEWLLKRLLHKPGAIYDPFLGSGTTLIAAEQLGRKCYGLEIDPAYCDVIVQRWEKLTGRKATLEQRDT